MTVPRGAKLLNQLLGLSMRFSFVLEQVTDQASTGMIDFLCGQLKVSEVLISHSTLDNWDVRLSQYMGLHLRNRAYHSHDIEKNLFFMGFFFFLFPSKVVCSFHAFNFCIFSILYEKGITL